MSGLNLQIKILNNNLDNQILKMIYGIKMQKKKIIWLYEGQIYMLEPNDVYYFDQYFHSHDTGLTILCLFCYNKYEK